MSKPPNSPIGSGPEDEPAPYRPDLPSKGPVRKPTRRGHFGTIRVASAVEKAVIAALLLMASVSIIRVTTKGIDAHASDFHAYWYSGHFIWQHRDPYEAWQQHLDVELPVHYLDGVTLQNAPVRQDGWTVTPANTAPVVLLMSILSRLSWTVAVRVWAGTNIVLAGTSAWLLCRLLSPKDSDPKRSVTTLAVLLSLIATREVIEYGQTTLLIFACMLTALLLGPRHPILSGIALGIAMSKYSLAFPVFLLFMYKRWYRCILATLGTQLIATALVAIIGGTTVPGIIANYVRIMLVHEGLPGMHLTSVLLRGWGDAGVFAVAGLTLAFAGYLISWNRSVRGTTRYTQDSLTLTDFLLLTAVMIWNLLVIYHRRYDNVAMILLIAIVLTHLGSRTYFEISTKTRGMVNAILIMLTSAWVLPIYILTGQEAYEHLFSFCNVVALGITLFLLHRSRPWILVSGRITAGGKVL